MKKINKDIEVIEDIQETNAFFLINFDTNKILAK